MTGWSSVPNWVIRSDALKGTEKLLYIALLNRANSKGESWPSLATLTKDVGVSRGTIVNRLEKLCTLGLIRKAGRVYKHGGQATNVYTILTWDAPQGGSASSIPPSANEERGVVQEKNGGSAGEEHEVLPIEVLPIRSTTHIPFESVWLSWPKKTEKERAEKEYLKHVKKVPELPGLVREFGEAYAATTEKRYIPSLAAWLHRKRWTDELPELDDSSHLTENQQRGLALMHAFKQQEVGEARGQIANG